MLRDTLLQVNKNKFHNISFQKSFYQWEQKERWFGLQLWQSLKISLQGASINSGIWIWHDATEEIELRIFFSNNSESTDNLMTTIKDNLERVYPNNRKEFWTDSKLQLQSIYTVVPIENLSYPNKIANDILSIVQESFSQ